MVVPKKKEKHTQYYSYYIENVSVSRVERKVIP